MIRILEKRLKFVKKIILKMVQKLLSQEFMNYFGKIFEIKRNPFGIEYK